jgi:cell division protein FtsB
MSENFLYTFVKKHRITKPLFIGYFVAFSIIFYFTFFIFFGEKGLIKFFTLKKQIENKEIDKQVLYNKMQAKKNMVDGMNLDSLDIDLLDEQSRKTLGYIGKNEVVIYREDSDQKN